MDTVSEYIYMIEQRYNECVSKRLTAEAPEWKNWAMPLRNDIMKRIETEDDAFEAMQLKYVYIFFIIKAEMLDAKHNRDVNIYNRLSEHSKNVMGAIESNYIVNDTSAIELFDMFSGDTNGDT